MVAGQMAKRSYILRAAIPDESGRLHKALEQWDDPYVLGRPESELKAAAEAGLFFIITDLADSKVLGTSAVFNLRNDEYVEIGTTYVGEELRGFRLQALFMRIRIASVVWSQGPTVQITTAIDPTNDRSLKSTRRCGFCEMGTLLDEQLAPCVGCNKRPPPGSANPCCCGFFVLPIDAARSQVQKLLDQVVSGVVSLRNEETGEEIELFVKAKAATDPDARTALAEFVAGATW